MSKQKLSDENASKIWHDEEIAGVLPRGFIGNVQPPRLLWVFVRNASNTPAPKSDDIKHPARKRAVK